MSYILDALKKAERERGIAQVPTLATVHETRIERPHRRLWIIGGISLVCIAAMVWAGILLLKSTTNPVPSNINAENVQNQDKTLLPAQSSPPSSPEAIVPAETTPVSPSVLPSKKSVIEETRAAVPKETPRQSEAATLPQRASIQLQPSPNNATPSVAEQASPTEAPQPNPMSFREAAAKMNITILMYAEAKSERMVFINDRKYVEGDYIEGRYLLETITPEGAVLSFQGERITIRPRTK